MSWRVLTLSKVAEAALLPPVLPFAVPAASVAVGSLLFHGLG